MLGQPLFANNSSQTCKMRLCAVRGLNTPDVRFCLVARVSDPRFVALGMAPHPLSAWAALAAGPGCINERTRGRRRQHVAVIAIGQNGGSSPRGNR
jgi:hypothetical protein